MIVFLDVEKQVIRFKLLFLIILTGVCLLHMMVPTEANAAHPSFNCGRATKLDELAICEDEELSRLDIQANEEYKKLILYLGKSKANEIARIQLSRRASCKSNARCIKNVTISSINVYKSYIETTPEDSLSTSAISAETSRNSSASGNSSHSMVILEHFLNGLNDTIIGVKSNIQSAPEKDKNKYTIIAILFLLFISSVVSASLVGLADSLSKSPYQNLREDFTQPGIQRIIHYNMITPVVFAVLFIYVSSL